MQENTQNNITTSLFILIGIISLLIGLLMKSFVDGMQKNFINNKNIMRITELISPVNDMQGVKQNV